MNVLERVANLLLGSALNFLGFRRCFSACARGGQRLISRAPVSSVRALRGPSIAALLLVALLPGLATGAPPSAAGNPSTVELEQLVQTLKNDKGREAFVAQLDALITAQRAVAAKPAEPEDLVSILSDRINALGDEVLAGAAVLVDAPLLLAWVKGQIANEYTRALWIQVAYSLVIVFGIGLVAEWIVRRLLARVLPRAPAPTRKRLPARLLLVGAP